MAEVIMYTYHTNPRVFSKPLIDFFFEKIHGDLTRLRDKGNKKCVIGFGNESVYVSSDDHDIRVSNPERYTFKMFNDNFSDIALDDRMTLDNLVIHEKVSRNGRMFFKLNWENISFEESVRLFDEFITPHLAEASTRVKKLKIFLPGDIVIKTDISTKSVYTNNIFFVDYALFKNLLQNIDLNTRMGVDDIKIAEKCSDDSIMYFELTW